MAEEKEEYRELPEHVTPTRRLQGQYEVSIIHAVILTIRANRKKPTIILAGSFSSFQPFQTTSHDQIVLNFYLCSNTGGLGRIKCLFLEISRESILGSLEVVSLYPCLKLIRCYSLSG